MRPVRTALDPLAPAGAGWIPVTDRERLDAALRRAEAGQEVSILPPGLSRDGASVLILGFRSAGRAQWPVANDRRLRDLPPRAAAPRRKRESCTWRRRPTGYVSAWFTHRAAKLNGSSRRTIAFTSTTISSTWAARSGSMRCCASCSCALGRPLHADPSLARVYEGMSSTDRHRFLRRVHSASPGAPQYVLHALGRERDPAVVARALIEGVEATGSFAAEVRDVLYHLQPMANLMFVQDVAVVLLDRVVQGYMSQLVRTPEEVVVETVIRSSSVFGPRGTGELWLDPDFRKRHRMQRTARAYLQIDAQG